MGQLRNRLNRRRAYGGLLLIAVVAAVTTILLVRSDGPPTLAHQLGILIVNEANHSCIGGEASLQSVTAAERPDLYHDLLSRAQSAELVSCDDLGAVSIVLHFKSRARLVRAFQNSRSARTSGWCVVGSSAFNGALLDHRSSLRRYCARLHGTLRPGPYRLSQTGS